MTRRAGVPACSAGELRSRSVCWLNLLCLDAPLVAVGWCWLFARSFGVQLGAAGAGALFLTAWLIYLADRLGDSLSVQQCRSTSLRQRFCLSQRRAWTGLILLLGIADLLLIATLSRDTLLAGAVVGAVALIYLVTNQAAPQFWRRVPLKEVTIGFLFAAGVLVPLAHGLTTSVLPASLLFAGLCALNCFCIAAWERELDLAQQRVSIATAFPSVETWMLPMLTALCLTNAAFAALAAPGAIVHLAVAVSAFLLAAVHLFREQLQPDSRTAMADLALLVPAVLVLLLF